MFKRKNKNIQDTYMCDNCCTPFIEGEGCSSALQKKASNVASGDYSIATGHGTIASNEGELSAGTYNKANPNQVFSVGIGTSDSDRRNAMQIDKDGSASFLHNGTLVKLTDLISSISPSSNVKFAIENGYIAVSYNGGVSYTPLISLEELRGPAGSGLTNVSAAIGVNDGGVPSVNATFSNGVLTLIFNNLGNGGSGTPLQVATASRLGGIKVGRDVFGKEYPVRVDDDGNAYVYVPWSANANLEPATADELGGIRIGFTDNNAQNKNYPVELTPGQHKAYVHVPWTGGSGDGGENGGHWESAFAGYDPAVTPTAASIPSFIDDTDPSATWKHSAPNNLDGSLTIWMATRWVDGDGTPNSWQGPWRISGPDGDNGTDGDKLEFIYTRTNTETSPVPSLSNTTPDPSSNGQTPSDNDFVPLGWKDNAMDASIQIDSTHRVMWMAFRVWSENRDPNTGVVTSGWSDFIGPIAWSIYGKSGMDGDGVEYIFYAGTTAPTENPHTWNKNTVGTNGTWADREFVKDGFDNVWVDDPINLDVDDSIIPQGTKQWVCIRRKYADEAENRSSYTDDTDVTQPYWHAFSQPALWGYKPRDGAPGSGIVADLDNEMIAVPLDSNGDCKEITQSTNAFLYSSGVTIPSTVTLVSIIDTDSPVGTYDNKDSFNNGNGYLVSINGNQVTITLKDGDVNLANKNLLVNLRLTSSADSTVIGNVTLTLVGVHFGSDGTSYRLGLNCRSIRHTEGEINPQYIDPVCITVGGLEPGAVYTPVPSSLSVLNGLVEKQFCFKYEIDDSGTIVDLNSLHIPTTASGGRAAIEDNIRVMLYYGDNPSDMSTLMLVDQETVFVISDGITPSARFKSVVFKRQDINNPPSRPGVGVNSSGSSAADDRGITNSNYGGTFADPIPYGWSDGIPAWDDSLSAEENCLWSTTRLFIESPTNTYGTVWSDPAQVNDTEAYDVEFALETVDELPPAIPTDDDVPAGSSNRHGCSPASNQIWFDPVLDSDHDFTVMAWKAERYRHNGVPEDWVITRIKGENGLPGKGISNMITEYGISMSPSTIPGNDAWVSDITQLQPNAGDWIWSRTTVTYTDNTSDVFYTKYRQVSDSTSTAVTFAGEYDNTKAYYGNTDRCDIVFSRRYNKYYKANPLQESITGNPSFTGIEPGVTSGWENYWVEFGNSYDNIATGFAFIEELVVKNLDTAGTSSDPQARIHASGNSLYMTDSNGEQKLLISADDIDVSSVISKYALNVTPFATTQEPLSALTNSTWNMSYDLGSFYATGGDYFNIDSFEINAEPATSSTLARAHIELLKESNGSYTKVRDIYTSSPLGDQDNYTFTVPLINQIVPSTGSYKLVLVFSISYTASALQSADKLKMYYRIGTLQTPTYNGVIPVYVEITGSNIVRIGTNGFCVNLGGNNILSFTKNGNSSSPELLLQTGWIGLCVKDSEIKMFRNGEYETLFDSWGNLKLENHTAAIGQLAYRTRTISITSSSSSSTSVPTDMSGGVIIIESAGKTINLPYSSVEDGFRFEIICEESGYLNPLSSNVIDRVYGGVVTTGLTSSVTLDRGTAYTVIKSGTYGSKDRWILKKNY